MEAWAVIEIIPIAALVGVMFMVVIGTFAWSSLRVMTKVPKVDAFIIILVSAVTVTYDLAIAVLIGVICSALSYVWQNAQHISATVNYDEGKDLKTYKIRGPLFFSSIASFKELFTPKTDPEHNVIDFSESRVWDHSALEAIEVMALKYKFLNKELKLKGLSQDCIKLLDQRGITSICNKEKEPHYSVVVDHS